MLYIITLNFNDTDWCCETVLGVMIIMMTVGVTTPPRTSAHACVRTTYSTNPGAREAARLHAHVHL